MKKLLFAVGLTALFALSAEAGVKVTKSSITFDAAPTAQEFADAKQQFKGKLNRIHLRLANCTDEALAAAAKEFPGTTELTIDKSPKLTSLQPLSALPLKKLVLRDLPGVKTLSPLAACKMLTQLRISKVNFTDADLGFCKALAELKEIRISDVPVTLKSAAGVEGCGRLSHFYLERSAAPMDLSALKACPKLGSVVLRYTNGFNLAPLSVFPALKELNLYGSQNLDLAPLAGCARLKEISVYATRNVKDYNALGLIKSLEKVNTGLTPMRDLSWTAQLPNLKKLYLFSETFDSFAPLANCAKLEELKLWNLKNPLVDAAQFVSGPLAGSLKKLAFTGTTVANEAKLAAFSNLKELELTPGRSRKAPSELDLAFVSSLKNLEKLKIVRTAAPANFAAVGSCAKLKDLEIVFPGADFSVAASLPVLKSVTVLKADKEAAEKAFRGKKIRIKGR
mgnify:CR=1 FL=1